MDFSTKQNNHPSPSIWNWYVRVFIFFSFFKLSSFFFNSKFFITTYFQLFLGKWNIWSSSEIDNIFFYFLYSRLKHYSATGLMVMGWFETRQNWKYIVSNSYSAYLVTFVLRNFNVSFSKNSSIDVVLISDSSIKILKIHPVLKQFPRIRNFINFVSLQSFGSFHKQISLTLQEMWSKSRNKKIWQNITLTMRQGPTTFVLYTCSMSSELIVFRRRPALIPALFNNKFNPHCPK